LRGDGELARGRRRLPALRVDARVSGGGRVAAGAPGAGPPEVGPPVPVAAPVRQPRPQAAPAVAPWPARCSSLPGPVGYSISMRRHLWLLVLIATLAAGLLTPPLHAWEGAAQWAPASSAGSGIDLPHKPLALVTVAVTSSSQSVASTHHRAGESAAP